MITTYVHDANGKLLSKDHATDAFTFLDGHETRVAEGLDAQQEMCEYFGNMISTWPKAWRKKLLPGFYA